MDFKTFRFSQPATEAVLAERKVTTLEALRHPNPQPDQTKSTATLPEDLASYLLLIHGHPDMPATARDRMAGISLRKGNQLRDRLQERGLIEAVTVNPGSRGRAFIGLRLTPLGNSALKTNQDGAERKAF